MSEFLKNHSLRIVNFLVCLFAAIILVNLSVHSTWAQTTDYRLTPGDRISINVYGEPELSFSAMTISNRGTFNYPFLGEVPAVGKTETELAQFIAEKLKDGFLLDPQVSVTISGFRPVFVEGAVNSPGQKPYQINMDIEKLLLLAGGLAEDGDIDDLVITREDATGKNEIDVEIDFKINPGDFLTVGRLPAAEVVDNNEYIYLYGEVRKPGRYLYSANLTVEKAIVIAGGFGNRASKRKISVSRGNPAVREKKVPLDYLILPGDVITIGASLF